MLKLTKRQTAEYNQLRKQFKISRKEYLDYYQDVRKSRAKQHRLTKQHTLRAPKFSTKINNITTRKEFLERRRTVKQTLKRSYRVSANEQQREQLYGNLRDYFGADAELIIDRLKDMSELELKAFFESNDDIDRIMYDSDTEILDAINETFEKFNTRLNIFDEYGI